MLCRGSKRLTTLSHHQYRYFAAASAFDGWNDRVSKLKSSYPKLFDASSFLSDQEKLLQSYKSSLPQLLSEYDSARQSIDSATGEPVFLTLNESELLNDLSTKNKPFYESLSTDSDAVASKLSQGQAYVNRVIELQEEQARAASIEEKNLKMIEIASIADKIDEWSLSFVDPVNDSSDLGLPISDEEVDEWVREQYHHAPDEVREQRGMTYEQHKGVEEKWMRTLDVKLCDVLKQRNSNFDEDKFKEFCDVTNDMFHPHSIDHYGMSNYAKSLFRAALWQSKARCSDVEESVEVLSALLADGKDDDATVIRGVYENAPNTRFANFAAFQLRITDPLFSAKLIQQIRIKLEEVTIERAKKDVLYDLQVPYLQAERNELETELAESMSTNPANMKRGIDVLQREEDSYSVEVPSLEQVLDEILATRLWQKDTDGVRSVIVSYCEGKGSLSDIDSAIDAALSSDASADLGGLSDEEILDISVKCHNSRTYNLNTYNFADLLSNSTQKRDLQSMLENKRMGVKRLTKLGIDPLVINLVKILVEDGTGPQLSGICADYLNIMKRFRGEIEGSVTSAQELDENVFGEIKNAIETANPGKKITLQRLVDGGLQSGFIVKAGVQRFDFSLATVIHQGRINASSAV
eukprot:275688_1